jgi:biopolymer transport protein ExbB
MTSTRLTTLIITTAGLAAIAIPRTTFGQATQESTSETRPTPDEAQLKSRLAALTRELKSERDAVASRKQSHDEEIKGLKAQRKAAAERLVAAQLERERHVTELKKMQAQRVRAADEAKALSQAADSLRGAVRGTLNSLARHLQQLPGGEPSAARVQKLISELDGMPDDERIATGGALVRQVFAEFDRTHREATSFAVSTTDLHTATGAREKVKLLSLGHARFAYQTVDDGRVGRAAAQSPGAAGYRWSEDLDGPSRDFVRQSIDQIEAGTNDWVQFPLNPTGKIAPSKGEGTTPSSNPVVGLFVHGGIIAWALATAATIAVAVLIDRLIVFVRFHQSFERTVAALRPLFVEKNWTALETYCKRRGPYTNIARAYLQHHGDTKEVREDRLQREAQLVLDTLDRRLRLMAVLAQVGTLLGLLGTFYFMVQRFSPASQADGPMRQDVFLSSIWQAFLCTMFGLSIAVPCTVLYQLFEARVDAVSRQMGVLVSLLDEWMREGADRHDAPRPEPVRGGLSHTAPPQSETPGENGHKSTPTPMREGRRRTPSATH